MMKWIKIIRNCKKHQGQDVHVREYHRYGSKTVQRFIRDCDSKDIVYALKTASEDMKNVFFANMSKRMAETVKGDLEITTNVRLKEVEEAQQRIVI